MDNKEKEKTGSRQEGLTVLVCVLLSVNVLISITLLWLVYSGGGAMSAASGDAVSPISATVMAGDAVDLPADLSPEEDAPEALPTPREPTFVQTGESQERIRHSLNRLRQDAEDEQQVADQEAVRYSETRDTSRPDYVQIRNGMTLRNLALRYYGSEVFWVCIYDHNSRVLHSPDVLPRGMHLALPRPSDYGIDANDPASLRRARALAKNLARL